MADELAWPVEEIPDSDSVFMRAHRMHFRDGKLAPSVFREQDGAMSVNWDKYATAEQTRQRSRKNPRDNAVLSMPVVGIRLIDSLRVEHTPEQENRAHSDVCGLPADREQLTEIRVLLLRISEIVLPLQNPE